MNGYETSDDHQPVTWFRGHPVYAAHLIVVAYVVSMFVTTVFAALNAAATLNWLTFSSAHVLGRGEVWRILSYGLVNPPSIQFAFDMVMIVWFGREVERFFGRQRFVLLYVCLYLLTPLLLTLIGIWQPTSLRGETGAFALFIAFATLYPNVPLFFNIIGKWMALILVSLFSLMAISERNLVGLVSLWATAGFAYAFVNYQQGHFSLPKFSLFRSKPKLRVLHPEPAVLKKSSAPKPEPESPMAEVDALLDKIARSGIGSLTAKERARLDAAAQLTRRRR